PIMSKSHTLVTTKEYALLFLSSSKFIRLFKQQSHYKRQSNNCYYNNPSCWSAEIHRHAYSKPFLNKKCRILRIEINDAELPVLVKICCRCRLALSTICHL